MPDLTILNDNPDVNPMDHVGLVLVIREIQPPHDC
jgi:hypothetical protein